MVSIGNIAKKRREKELMTTNPFEMPIDEIEHEIELRKARSNYLNYVMYTNPGYKASKFHTYLCNAIHKFIETDTSAAFDILLLSVP